MSRRTASLHRLVPALAFGTFGLAACGETAPPTQPDLDGAPASAAVSFARNTWVPRTPHPQFNPSDDFFGFSLVEAPDAAGRSTAFAVGGTFGESGGAANSSVIPYDVESDTWGPRRNGRVGAFDLNGAAKMGTKLYFSGGYNQPGTLRNSVNFVRAYDLVADRMVEKAPLPIYSAEGVSGVIKGRLYVLPGACSTSETPVRCAEEATRRFYRYDPVANKWATLPQAPHFHRGGGAAVLDGKFYVAGGIGERFEPLAHLDVYDPTTNAWRTLAPLPTGGRASAGVLQGRLFVVVNGAQGIRLYAYTPGTNRWEVRAPPDFFGPVTRVTLDGRPRLFMADRGRAALYTP